MTVNLNQLKGRHGMAVRYYGADSPQARQAAEELAAAKASIYIERILAEAPPLTPEQRTRLAELLKPVRVNGGGVDGAA